MPTHDLVEEYMQSCYSVYGLDYLPGQVFTYANTSALTPLWGMPGTRVTNSNPNYKDQISKHVNAATPYLLRTLYGWRVGRTKLICREPSGVDFAASEMMWHGSMSLTPGIVDAVLADQALTRLKRKLKTQVGSFEALVPLAEARDLRRTVKSAVELTTGVVRSLLEIKKTRGKSAYKYASKAWITYGFGIRPTMSDISALGNSISSYLTRSDRSVVRLVGGASKTWVSSPTGVDSYTFNRLAPAESRHRVEHTLSYRYISAFGLPLKSGNNYGAMQHYGLDLPSLFPALWEATVFSWVVDYFGTVGAFLEDTFESPPGTPVYVVLNRLYVAKISTSITPKLGPTIQVFSRVDGFAKGTYVEFERSLVPGDTLPRSALRFKTLDEVGLFGVSKLLNLAAILGSSR